MTAPSDTFRKLVHPLGVAALLGLLLLCIFGVQVAQAEEAKPGWEVTSTTFPTNLAPGSAVDEVQEVAVAATEGAFTLSFGEHETSPIKYNAPAATVQAELQALPSVGAGNVTVTGGPVGEPPVVPMVAGKPEPYVLTFTGTLADRETGEVSANDEQLEGGTATSKVKTRGVPSGNLELNVYNIGAAPSSGPVTVTDTLPPGIVATEAGDVQKGSPQAINEAGLWECYGDAPGESPRAVNQFNPATVVTCTNSPTLLPALPIPARFNSYTEGGGGMIGHIAVAVKVETSTPGALENHVTVAGGGAAAPASTSSAITVSSTPASAFGFQDSDGWFSSADGAVDTQAGSHPYEFTYSFDLNTFEKAGFGLYPVDGQPRNLAVNLPPGFIGNPTAVPECTRQQFDLQECSPATQVGVDVPEVQGAFGEGSIVPTRFAFPVYNLVPPPGMPAQFAFAIDGVQAFLDASVRSGGDYGITVHVYNIVHKIVVGNRITFWGEPSDPSHDGQRSSVYWQGGTCREGCSSSAQRIPFLTTPTSCTGPQTFSANLDSWETAGSDESSYKSHEAGDLQTGFTGCDFLGFDPTISAAPDTTDADTPAGLTVDVKVPQEGLTTPGALATSNIRDTTVVLPPGVVINPGQAAGLRACQQGPTEPQPSGELLHPGRDNLPLAGENGEEQRFEGPPDCPNASKVGTVEIETPLLHHSLKGDVYVLQSNPPDLQLLVAAEGEGVFLKLVGHVSLCEAAGEVLDGKTCEALGQLITKFSETPELPFTNFELSFSGGAQAALATPVQCGTYTTTSDFTPWSAPAVGEAFPSSGFAVSGGPGGSACPSGVLPFGPSLVAGATNPKGGAFTGFSLLLQSGDEQNRIEKLQFKAPEGLSGMLSAVPLCGEPQAAQGTCSAASQIGHSTVAAGPGSYPLTIPQPGEPESPIYLTGPYGGAPFGLSIVTHVLAGPFDLGNVITRARIEVDPLTAQITVTTDPLPQVIDGVPTDLRLVDAVIDRPGFMFNPTHCAAASFAGTAWGAPPPGVGGLVETAPIASSFDVVGCKGLGFAPDFKVSTSGKTSKAGGASLTAKIVYPTGQSYANIARVKVELPKQLPSRLTTLQKACTAAQFEADPAGCPAASVIGHARALTPVLPVPLEGPAYFVSHGGEAFPSLIMVLQGYGVRIDLVGTTFISKAGITSSTFKAVPDQPLTSFELTLPEGKYSALAANGKLCKPTTTRTVKKKVTLKVKGHTKTVTRKVKETVAGSLAMPNEFIAQNGAAIKQTTKITVTGCPKIKAAKKATKKHNKKTKKATTATTNRRARS